MTSIHSAIAHNPHVSAMTMGLSRKAKTHHYTLSRQAHDHVFSPKPEGGKAYMTEQGKGVKPGDYLILQAGSSTNRYQVDKISYYADPPDMWIASLKQC